jgi:hypothetical protein
MSAAHAYDPKCLCLNCQPHMTLEQFRATGRDVEDLRAVLELAEQFDGPSPGRVYAGGGYIERFGAAWCCTIANDSRSGGLANMEAFLYEWAVDECDLRVILSARLTPKALAREFSRVLRSWLSPAQMRAVRERNKTQKYAKCCASHDFCDANMAMLEACAKLTGKPETDHDFADEDLCAIVNSAWALARAGEFRA